ncbi:hypothetical protein ACRC7T_11790 [Segnochrobactraceae bacterium EtOH-i3]
MVREMATITYKNTAPPSLWDTLPYDFETMTIKVNATKTVATVVFGGNDGAAVTSLSITGTGLKADADGFLAGTITGLSSLNSAGQVIYQAKGLNLRASGLDLFDSWLSKGLLLSGNDRITGSTRDDDIQSGAGNDTVKGGLGDDSFQDHVGNDTYDGGSGEDFVYYSQSYYDSWYPSKGVTVNLQTGKATDPWGYTDTLISIEDIRGTQYGDKITGSNKNVFESFQGIAGNDTIDGGGGNEDRVDYHRDARFGGRSGVTVDLGKGKAIDGFGDIDTLRNIEQAGGSNYADTLTGSSGANLLRGRGGNDILNGKGGGDTLEGEAGNDVLYGTTGSRDTFRFRDRDDGVTDLGTDRVKSFRDGEDVINFRDIDGLDNIRDLALSQTGKHVTITYDLGKIVVENITVSKLTAADFDFL